MLNNIADLKELVLWAKKQKLRALKVGEVSFEFSDLALIEEGSELTAKTPIGFDSKTMAEAELSSPEEDEKLLFWSTPS